MVVDVVYRVTGVVSDLAALIALFVLSTALTLKATGQLISSSSTVLLSLLVIVPVVALLATLFISVIESPVVSSSGAVNLLEACVL